MAPPSVYCGGSVFGNAVSVRGCEGFIYVITSFSGSSTLYKVNQADGSAVKSVAIGSYDAVRVAVSPSRDRVAVSTNVTTSGAHAVKMFDSDLNALWGATLPEIDNGLFFTDVRILSTGDAVYGAVKSATDTDQNTLFLLDAADGSTTWSKRFPDVALSGSQLNRIAAIAVDGDDNIYVTGSSTSGASNNVAKFNAAGVQQWTYAQSFAFGGGGVAYSPTPYLFVQGASSTAGERRSAATGALDTSGTVVNSFRWHHDGIDALYIPTGGTTARSYSESFSLNWSYALGSGSTLTGVVTDPSAGSYWSHYTNAAGKNLTKLDADGALVWAVLVGGGNLWDIA